MEHYMDRFTEALFDELEKIARFPDRGETDDERRERVRRNYRRIGQTAGTVLGAAAGLGAGWKGNSGPVRAGYGAGGAVLGGLAGGALGEHAGNQASTMSEVKEQGGFSARKRSRRMGLGDKIKDKIGRTVDETLE